MVYSLFKETIEDQCDVFGRMAMDSEGLERLTYWKDFEKFYGLLPKDSKLNYGRVFTQRWIVKEIVALTIASMVDAGEDFDSDEYDDFASRSLPEWTKEDWEAFKNSIVNLKANVLQRGATASLDEEDNNAPDTARCRNNIYSIDKILRIVDVNVIFSPLRGALMEQLKDENKEGVAEVDKELLSSFLKSVEAEKNVLVKKSLMALLKEDETTGAFELKDLNALRSIIVKANKTPFSLEKFTSKVIKTLLDWSKELFEDPRLFQIYFPDESEEEEVEEIAKEEQDAAFNKLRNARSVLHERVEDPLNETLEQAAEATRGKKRSPRLPGSSAGKRRKRGHLYKRKSSATALSFDDSVQEDESENISEPADDAVLSELPRRAGSHSIQVQRRRSMSPRTSPLKKSQMKRYPGRRLWSDHEKRAVKEGIRQLGTGHWADIKDRYKVILDDRTSGQIKDCFRTMKKRGELDDLNDL